MGAPALERNWLATQDSIRCASTDERLFDGGSIEGRTLPKPSPKVEKASSGGCGFPAGQRGDHNLNYSQKNAMPQS